MWSLILSWTITNISAKAAKNWWLRPCFQFCHCIGTLIEEYLVISSVYALIDYVTLIFYLRPQTDHTWTIYGPDYGQPGTTNIFLVRLWSALNQPFFIMAKYDLFLYGRETRMTLLLLGYFIKRSISMIISSPCGSILNSLSSTYYDGVIWSSINTNPCFKWPFVCFENKLSSRFTKTTHLKTISILEVALLRFFINQWVRPCIHLTLYNKSIFKWRNCNKMIVL